MKRIVWRGVDRLVLEEGPIPPLHAPGDVRIRVTAAGVCSTDLHIVGGSLVLGAPPRVLGHEIAGVVESCGTSVRRFRPGDRVKCDSVIGCGACPWCERGAAQFCPAGGELGMTCDGGWAEYVVAPERNLHRLPDAISDEVAAILDTEVYGALRKPGIGAGETVAIFGPGPAGLIAVQLVRLMGAARVILCGTRADRLALGRRLGADHAIDIHEQDAVAAIVELTGGRGADVSFDAAGTPAAATAAIECLRPQGRAILYGLQGRAMPDFPVDRVVLRDLVVYGALSDRLGWDDMLGWAAAGRLDLASLITHTYPLEQAAEAVACARDRSTGSVKVVLRG